MDELLSGLRRAAAPNATERLTLRLPGRLLYSVNHSLPFSSNGYAVRTHSVAGALVQAGLQVIAASRPGLSLEQARLIEPPFALEHRIDGVRYVHTLRPSLADMPLEVYLMRTAAAFQRLMEVFKPCAVLAASNWQNALPAALAARQMGLPFYYEVRGFWEISRASREPGWLGSAEFNRAVMADTAIATSAERVFTINRFMAEELVRRGVERKRIDLVPNGFPGWHEPPSTRVSRAMLGIRSRFVVGYVGSFNVYEGLDDLIEALAIVRRRGTDLAVLLVGSSEPMGLDAGTSRPCASAVAYRELAKRLGVADSLIIHGRVPSSEVAAYYAVLDAVVIPRRPFAVCEIVSPMKPLEAASHGKRVLMSDVAPLADLAPLCPNFSYFEKGNAGSLAERLIELLAVGDFTPPRCETLTKFTWEKNVAPIVAAVHCASQSARADGSACVVP